ncbi:MAG: pyridoxal-phosphate dependent enzyme [Bacteroidia bacterium]|nr:pyridoxal-phosphate dependent enzyme [Bacteroidia bacterium]
MSTPSTTPAPPAIPTLDKIREAHTIIADQVLYTPVFQWDTPEKTALLGADTEVWIKLELLQHGGSFKARGALLNLMALDEDTRARGVTAVSAGNHAIAVAWAAARLGISAKVVMPATANPFRVKRCQAWGAEVVLAANVRAAFEETTRIQAAEGRTFIHPFEGAITALGTAGVGLELAAQVPDLDALILPIGGGGLAAGMASAFHHLQPACVCLGIEPEGANSMQRSFRTGQPEAIEAVHTIADSLGAPFAMPYSFGLCYQLLREVRALHDDQLREAMRLMITEMKLAPEPACAASLAGLLGPYKAELTGKRVGLIACGANLDADTLVRLLNA